MTRPAVTHHQLRKFAAYLRAGSLKEVTPSGNHGTMSRLYAALGVDGHLEAARVLGWLVIPDLKTFAEADEIIARVHAARSAPDARGGQAPGAIPAAGDSVAFSTGERDASGSEHAA